MGTQPNIVLVTVDCFRYDRCGFNGHHRETTPRLDRLAGESHVFDQAFATGPQTVESFPGIIGGLHSYNAAYCRGSIDWKALPPRSPTLATYLKANGYLTVATIANTFITEAQNYDAGFDHFQNLEADEIGRDQESGDSQSRVGSWIWDNLTSVVQSGLKSRDGVRNWQMLFFVIYQYRRVFQGWPCIHAEEMIDRLLLALEDTDTPFFGWTHLMDLHAPIHPGIVDQTVSNTDSLFEHFVTEGARDGDIFHPKFESVYDGALAYVDRQIGRLIDQLKERREWTNTILIVTGDHGEALHDRGLYGHPTHYLYNDVLHVPFLIRTPERVASRIQSQFSLAWIHELFSELLDIPPSSLPASSGRDGHLSDPEDATVVVSDSISSSGHTIAAQTGKHKHITHHGEEILGDYRSPRDTYYRVESDIGERNPLAEDEGPATLSNLTEELRVEPQELEQIDHELSSGVESRLNELGYVL